MNEAIALVALAACLVAAVARRREAPDWAVAVVAAAVVLATGAIDLDGVGHALSRLGPTIGFLAALLVLADGCRRAGVFETLGAMMATGARDGRGGCFALVFAAAGRDDRGAEPRRDRRAADADRVATAADCASGPGRTSSLSHLANSASLLLPVSNLTNLLAFTACGISFTRFAGLMALPWAVALAIEWIVLSRVFADDLRPSADVPEPAVATHPEVPRLALGIVALTLAGFAVSSIAGVAPVWFATAGALAITIARPPESARSLAVAAEPTFLVFVAGLGIVVAAAGAHGLTSVVRSVLPSGTSLPALLAVAAVSAVLANLVNNLPATLIIVAVVVAGAPGAVLAMLIGVNVGPNLTYVGSLATLLWRRIIHAHDEQVDAVRFLTLGALTVPATLVGGDRGAVVGSAGDLMRALVWITESSWPACIDRARELLPAGAEITILHVASSDVEALAEHPAPGLLGRHRPPPPGPTVRQISDDEAAALLDRVPCAARTGRPRRSRAAAASSARCLRRPTARICSSSPATASRAWSPGASVARRDS